MTLSHHLSKRLVFNCFLALALVLDPFFISVTVAQTTQLSEKLEPGKPVVYELKGGEKHRYPMKLKANDFLKLAVEQRGIDVAVRLLGPDGKILQEVDSPGGRQGTESLSYITDLAGSYTLEIEALEKAASPGRYEFLIYHFPQIHFSPLLFSFNDLQDEKCIMLTGLKSNPQSSTSPGG